MAVKNTAGTTFTVTLNTEQIGYYEVYLWLQREKIEYQLGIPYGRDFIYTFTFQQPGDAVLFSLVYADYAVEN